MTHDLLELAEHIARIATSRPKQAYLRRAVSTAYYAAFHAFCSLCAHELVGAKAWDYFSPIYRSVDHRAFRKLASRPNFSPALRSLLVLMIELQEQRHQADYAPEQLWLTKSGTLDVVASARDLVGRIGALSSDDRLLLAVSIVSRDR